MKGYKITINGSLLGVFGSKAADQLGFVLSQRGSTSERLKLFPNEPHTSISFSVYSQCKVKPTTNRNWIRFYPLTVDDEVSISLVETEQFNKRINQNPTIEIDNNAIKTNSISLNANISEAKQHFIANGEDFEIVDLCVSTNILNTTSYQTYIFGGQLQFERSKESQAEPNWIPTISLNDSFNVTIKIKGELINDSGSLHTISKHI